jgi:uncharacterized coiled-coil DUF342 family protein
MPKQRWRHGVREDLRGVRAAVDGLRDEIHRLRDEMRDEIRGMRGDLRREFQQNRDVLRHLKASIDQNAELTRQCVETLEVVRAESHASRIALEDLSDDVRAQRDGLLLVLDELRRHNGSS